MDICRGKEGMNRLATLGLLETRERVPAPVLCVYGPGTLDENPVERTHDWFHRGAAAFRERAGEQRLAGRFPVVSDRLRTIRKNGANDAEIGLSSHVKDMRKMVGSMELLVPAGVRP